MMMITFSVNNPNNEFIKRKPFENIKMPANNRCLLKSHQFPIVFFSPLFIVFTKKTHRAYPLFI